jgi:DNA-binding LacI/PurR family transcriptional regulator
MEIALKSKTGRKTGGITDVLRSQINSGVLKPGTKIMSARELSHHFQVSLVTANKALMQLAEENLIVRNDRSGSFVKKNHQAEIYKIGFVDNISIFRPEIQGSCGLYRDTCIEMLYENQCHVRFLNTQEIAEAVLEREFDAVLCYYGGWDDETMARMKKTKVPLVLGRFDFVLNTPFHQVLPDIHGAVFEVFRRIRREQFDGLILVYENHENCLYRRDVALALARQAGFADSDIELVKAAHREVEMNYPLWQDISRRCRRKFIYTCGDVMAAGLIRVLQEAGIELGTETQLASLGNLEDSGYQPFDEPTITGAGTCYREYGKAAVRLLLRALESPEENRVSQIIRVPAVFKKRKTAFVQ